MTGTAMLVHISNTLPGSSIGSGSMVDVVAGACFGPFRRWCD